MNLEKKPRQSTDLAEYDFIVPKNFIELQVGAKFSTFEKSEKSGFSQKSWFFLGKSKIQVFDLHWFSELMLFLQEKKPNKYFHWKSMQIEEKNQKKQFPLKINENQNPTMLFLGNWYFGGYAEAHDHNQWLLLWEEVIFWGGSD